LNKPSRFISGQFFLTFALLTPISFSTVKFISLSEVLKISDIKNYPTDSNRDIYSTFDTEDQNDQGLPIDPFDLMNRLKQIGAMNDATTPSDALDDALNSFNQLLDENVPIK